MIGFAAFFLGVFIVLAWIVAGLDVRVQRLEQRFRPGRSFIVGDVRRPLPPSPGVTEVSEEDRLRLDRARRLRKGEGE